MLNPDSVSVDILIDNELDLLEDAWKRSFLYFQIDKIPKTELSPPVCNSLKKA
jgi:hypothetical protein